jgi:hypothetical protein
MSFSEEKLSDVSFLTDVFVCKGLEGRDCNEALGEIDLILAEDDLDDPPALIPSEEEMDT